MAKKKGADSAPSDPPDLVQSFQDDALYDVRVSRVIDVAGARLRPKHPYTVKGKVATELRTADALASAAAVD